MILFRTGIATGRFGKLIAFTANILFHSFVISFVISSGGVGVLFKSAPTIVQSRPQGAVEAD